MSIQRNRYPWTPADEAHIIKRRRERAPHKIIARELQRTPRAIDQHVAEMKMLGLLQMHRDEELELLDKVVAESLMPDVGERR